MRINTRELKFKVWDKRSNYMSGPRTMRELVAKGRALNKDVVFLQFTNYQDSIENEIYEGDILVDEFCIGIVYYNEKKGPTL